MQQVFITAVGLFLGYRYGDIMLLGEFDQLGSRIQIPDPPRGDDFQSRVKPDITEFKADLIVALAGGAMTHRIGSLGPGDSDLLLGDQRPGQRGAEQIGSFVDGIGPEGRENVVFDKTFLEIGDHHLFRPGCHSFVDHCLPVFFLADIGTIGNNRAVILLGQPFENNRGIEPA